MGKTDKPPASDYSRTFKDVIEEWEALHAYNVCKLNINYISYYINNM